jgi:hypothetical protein
MENPSFSCRPAPGLDRVKTRQAVDIRLPHHHQAKGILGPHSHYHGARYHIEKICIIEGYILKGRIFRGGQALRRVLTCRLLQTCHSISSLGGILRRARADSLLDKFHDGTSYLPQSCKHICLSGQTCESCARCYVTMHAATSLLHPSTILDIRPP